MPQKPVAPAKVRPAPTKPAIPRRGHESAQQHAGQYQQTGSDLNLAHDFERGLAVFMHREPGLDPGVEPALEDIGIALHARRQPVTGAVGAHAGAAGEDHIGSGIDREVRLLPLRERLRDRAFDMQAGKFVSLADIDQNGHARSQAGADFGRSEGVELGSHVLSGPFKGARRAGGGMARLAAAIYDLHLK
jgi:hypothetical protein